jgi:hypothetical protein
MKKGVRMRITKVYTKIGDKGKTLFGWWPAGLEGQCAGRGLRRCGRTELDARSRRSV